MDAHGITYARTALLRFSSATRGRFWGGADLAVWSSMTGGVNEGEVGRASFAEKCPSRRRGNKPKVRKSDAPESPNGQDVEVKIRADDIAVEEKRAYRVKSHSIGTDN